MHEQIESFISHVQAAITAGTFQKVILSKPTKDNEVVKILAKPVEIKNQLLISIVTSHKTKDITKNVAPSALCEELKPLLGSSFLKGHLFTNSESFDFSITKRGKAFLSKSVLNKPVLNGSDLNNSPESTPKVSAHDREKNHIVDSTRGYLHELGVTNPNGQVVGAMARKFKQINSFVDLFDKALSNTTLTKRFTVYDFGAGRGYLTFALADHINQTLKRDCKVVGVELREELVEQANKIAKANEMSGLSFICGDIAKFEIGRVANKSIDVMVALHACDTATDIAIATAIAAKSKLIICSPCCHKELRPQIDSPDFLEPLLEHGIQLGQMADMLTDTIRCLLLTAHGYETSIFEFVSLEHSAKNKMIRAIATTPDVERQTQALKKVAELKARFGITSHYLEVLLPKPALEAQVLVP